MTPYMIVGIVFTAFLIAIFVWILATDKKFAAIQQTVIIVLEALCAGFASAGFIGDARLQATGKLQGTDYALTAGGGFAMAIIVGYGMSVLLQKLGKSEASGVSFSWPPDQAFDFEDRHILSTGEHEIGDSVIRFRMPLDDESVGRTRVLTRDRGVPV